ncbi:MAG: stage III sporulation protein SpoIIIAB [Bacilli bacterium]
MKLIASIMIIAASTLWGMNKAFRYSKRVNELRQLQQAFKLLETEIVYGFTPLAEAFLHISQRHNGSIGKLFAQMGIGVNDNQNLTTGQLWEVTLDRIWSETALKKRDREILHQLGAQLGATDRQDQIKHIQLALRMLESEEMDAQHEQKMYASMYRNLGVLGGLLLVILMY